MAVRDTISFRCLHYFGHQYGSSLFIFFLLCDSENNLQAYKFLYGVLLRMRDRSADGVFYDFSFT